MQKIKKSVDWTGGLFLVCNLVHNNSNGNEHIYLNDWLIGERKLQ